MTPKSKSVTVTVTKYGEIKYGKVAVTGRDMLDMDRAGMLGPYTIAGKKRVGRWHITPGKYKVTYRLDPKGEYKMGSYHVMPVVIFGPGDFDFIHVCFLPDKWKRRRVSRTVRRVK